MSSSALRATTATVPTIGAGRVTSLAIEPPATVPTALNLFMNVPVAPDGSFKILPPVSRPGDHVSFRAELDCLIALSACPVDMLPLNGPDRRPRDVEYPIAA